GLLFAFWHKTHVQTQAADMPQKNKEETVKENALFLLIDGPLPHLRLPCRECLGLLTRIIVGASRARLSKDPIASRRHSGDGGWVIGNGRCVIRNARRVIGNGWCGIGDRSGIVRDSWCIVGGRSRVIRNLLYGSVDYGWS